MIITLVSLVVCYIMHCNQAEKVFIALFYEQADHQENFYFTECKIILIFAENLVITVILARQRGRGQNRGALRAPFALPYYKSCSRLCLPSSDCNVSEEGCDGALSSSNSAFFSSPFSLQNLLTDGTNRW